MTGVRAAVFCLGLACSPAFGLPRGDAESGADAPLPQDAIPSRLCRNLFFVPVTLADRPEYPQARTLWFVYDTGNNHTVVDPESIERVTGRDLDGVDTLAAAAEEGFTRHLAAALRDQLARAVRGEPRDEEAVAGRLAAFRWPEVFARIERAYRSAGARSD